MVGVLAIPVIIQRLGVDRFGVLTLAWMVIGYFSLFDFGLGRAVTKFAAELLGSRNSAGFNRLVWTAWYLMFAVGIVGAAILAAIAPWLVSTAIKLPGYLRHETLQMFYLLALSVPIVVLTAGFRGLLEGAQLFRLTSLIKIPTGVLTFVTPLLVLPFTHNLATIVLMLIAVRLVGAIAYAVLCHTAVHRHDAPVAMDRSAARSLIGFGAWMTVSNVISPLMGSVDRFLVGALLSIAAVAYYATPFEAVTKLLIIPSSITAVLFPAFSTASMIDRARLAELFRVGLRVVFLAMYPLVFLIVTFAPELLRFWLGDAFATQSSDALRWLAVGVLMNSLASLPFALLQGVGRSDTTAKIHLAEAPVYLGLVIWLIRQYGITGAAFAWSTRTTVDMCLLFLYSGRQFRTTGSGWLRDLLVVVVLVAVLGVGPLLRSPLQKVILTSILATLFAVFAWNWIGASVRRRYATGLPGDG
jgi:O-antigen/teichoic acid export membrane protein